ncbi:hypothetical protein QTP88_006376 [Uroleucon formosanum]
MKRALEYLMRDATGCVYRRMLACTVNSGKRESYRRISRYPASKDFFACIKTTTKSAATKTATTMPPRRVRERTGQYTPSGTHSAAASHGKFRTVGKGNGRVTRWRPSGIDHSPDVPGVRIKTDMCFRDEDYDGKNKRNDDH